MLKALHEISKHSLEYILKSDRDIVGDAVLPESACGELLLDEGLGAVHDSAAGSNLSPAGVIKRQMAIYNIFAGQTSNILS